ncbi:MAG: class I SAM-dependent methyltransferase [Candidatus Omnitrophota bacterium]|nr:class I SAM-dependent methyltransferase [Candidatus Omnitrophota bacterium]
MLLCRACYSESVFPMLDVGLQPLSNRFVCIKGEEEPLFPFKWNLCRRCGLVQFDTSVPADELKPRFNWITYSEPEDHLDDMVDMLEELPGMTTNSLLMGVSYKDDTTLRRFEKKGVTRTIRIDQAADLGITDRCAGIETLQNRIIPERMLEVSAKYGRVNMVIVRQVLEHAEDLRAFLNGLKELIAPGGYVVIEVPDSLRAIERCDYTMLWEEHVVYFTPSTFRRCLNEAGFNVVNFIVYPYTFEDSLVCVAQIGKHGGVQQKEEVKKALLDAEHFAKEFKGYGIKFKNALEAFYREKGKIAIFGAGHQACGYVNFFGLTDLIDFVVDDNPNKKELFMPGSQLPILSSRALLERDIKLCLLTINPIREENVLLRNCAFVGQGGQFRSIFLSSRHAFKC